MPEVSVIVPVYNSEKYLERCVLSILNQSFRSFEIVLVDDGSTDSSGEICDSLQNKFSEFIRVFHKQNGGISDARNKGIDKAVGKYIMFCDNDDTVESKWIETLYTCITRNPDSLVNCEYICVDVPNYQQLIKELPNVAEEQSIPFSEYYTLYKYGYSSNIWIRIFRSDIIRNNHIRFDTSIKKGGEDTLFNLEYMKYCNNFIYVKKGLYNWIDNGSSTSRDYEPHSYQKIRDLYFPRLPYISEQYKNEFYDEYFWRIYNCIQICDDPRNPESFREKSHYCNYILKDEVFRHALSHASEKACGKRLKFILNLRSYRILKIYEKMMNIIKKIIKGKLYK